MKAYEYKAFAFRQKPKSPIQIAAVIPAGELTIWCGVPRKSDELLGGYQRIKDIRRIDKEIVPFFNNDYNCSPTAIIIALRKDSGLGSCNLIDSALGKEIDETTIGETPVEVTLKINMDESALNSEAIFEIAEKYINSRLGPEENEPEEDDGTEDENAQESEENNDPEEEDSDKPIDFHLGTITLKRMKELLGDKNNWTNEGFRESVRDFVKPAFIIDGQHRAFAANRFGSQGLPFLTCGLYDAAWPEQVFHFTIVNLKPKRIQPQLITSIAALSLTGSEQKLLQGRLKSAGVRMTEVEVMSKVAYEEASPFYNMVDTGTKLASDRNSYLGYGGMKRIAFVWYRAKHVCLTHIAKQLFKIEDPKHARSKFKDFKDGVWFDFFCAFWDAIRNFYNSDELWGKRSGNKLLVATNLWALQEAILLQMSGWPKKNWDVSQYETFEERMAELLKIFKEDAVLETIKYFPMDLWIGQHWMKDSQDTDSGRSDLVALFKKFIDEGSNSESEMWPNWRDQDWFKQK